MTEDSTMYAWRDDVTGAFIEEMHCSEHYDAVFETKTTAIRFLDRFARMHGLTGHELERITLVEVEETDTTATDVIVPPETRAVLD